MAAPLESILKLLSEEFEIMAKTFPTDDWKKFKFGLGGPHKRTLTKLQYLSNDHDQVIFDHFGANEETASFNKLIVICLRNDKTYKELYKHVTTFRRQIKRMGRALG